MYRFNGFDGRLDRMIEIAILIMESLSNASSNIIDYSISGHSGDSFSSFFNLLFVLIYLF